MSFIREKLIPVGLLFLALTGVFTLVAIKANADPQVLDKSEVAVSKQYAIGLCEYFDDSRNDNTVGVLVALMFLQDTANIKLESAVKVLNYSIQNNCPKHQPLLLSAGQEMKKIYSREKVTTGRPV